MSESKERLELADKLAARLTGRMVTVGPGIREEIEAAVAALRASAVAEPVQKTDAEHFGDILKTEAARLRAMADRFDPAPAPVTGMTYASIEQRYKAWRGSLPVVDRPSLPEAFGQGYAAGWDDRENFNPAPATAVPEDTPETVATELAYFDAHAERFAGAHQGLLSAPTQEGPKASGAYQLTADEASIIKTCAHGRLWARDHAIEAHRRAIRDSGPAPGNPFYDFMSEIDSPCPDLTLRRRHRQRIIEGEPK